MGKTSVRLPLLRDWSVLSPEASLHDTSARGLLGDSRITACLELGLCESSMDLVFKAFTAAAVAAVPRIRPLA
jgi:hypothetical protein